MAAAGTPGTTGDAKTTGIKTTGTQGKTETTAASSTTPATDPSATANPAATSGTPQPAVDAKTDATTILAAAIKPDRDAAATPSVSSTTGHDRSAAAGNTQAPQTDANTQVFVLPQQLSAATTVSGTDKLTATGATGGAVPVSGLAVEIAASARSGKTSFEVRLDPADLGRIDVKIDVDRNGQVTSHLTVEKPETLSMLRQDAPQLQQALNDAGLKTGSGGLQFSLRDQSSSGQNSNFNQSGGQPQRLVISEDDSVPTAVAGRSYGRMLGASGGVDISV
ncbi:MAG: flagellar hook-length control protein FliK [Bradyrhizobium sp.]|nr:flagellar hook-length control protein FliK [Bradyrhizobium sp.]